MNSQDNCTFEETAIMDLIQTYPQEQRKEILQASIEHAESDWERRTFEDFIKKFTDTE